MPNPYIPPTLPVAMPFDAEIQRMLSVADRALGGFRELVDTLPNPDLLLAPMKQREAVMSAHIEGSEATFSDVLLFEAGMDAPRAEMRDDRREIINYRRALADAEGKMRSGYPFDMWMLRGMHQTLLGGSVRGNDKKPGAFRERQNWIGPPGVAINPQMATYIPPPPEKVAELMDNWLAQWHINENAPLVQMAILHGQFEMIHPFEDGNGRVGRLLIPLFLYNMKVLHHPIFYLSEQLLAQHEGYYAGLRALSAEGDWRGWLMFFLTACAKQAQSDKAIAAEILGLRDWMLRHFAKSRYSAELITAIFIRPVFTLRDLQFSNKAPSALTLRKLIDGLEQKGIVEQKRRGTRGSPSIYAFPKLLEICER